MKILGIETSSPIFSLSLHEDRRLLYEIRKDRLVESSARDAHLFVETKRLIEILGKEKIGAIAVSLGPGMFTSLRLGLSLAKAIALAQDIPVLGVNTLDAIGLALPFFPGPILATINAFHQEIYAALYEKNKRISDYLLTTPAAILARLKKRLKNRTIKQLIIAGSGVGLFLENNASQQNYAVLTNNGQMHFSYADLFQPTASRIVQQAFSRIEANSFDNPDTLEPFYIKKTDAERRSDKF